MKETLTNYVFESIERVAKEKNTPEKKREALEYSYRFITANPTFVDPNSNVLLELIVEIDDNIYKKTRGHEHLATEFYNEFIKYSGGDGQSLGMVMTPRHICDLFVEMADLRPASKVLDICMGTAGFLTAAAKNVKPKFGNDKAAFKKFEENNLVGVDQQPNMFTLSYSDMLLRDRAPENFYLANSFNLSEELKECECNVGFLNPPYSQKGEGLKELDFVYQMLECLKEGSLGFAIVPVNCALEKKEVKEKILNHHTLVAAMSMPDDLFYPVGVVTCVMVFQAHKPHNSNRPTWFGYWKNDGMIKIKKEGRVDYHKKWHGIKNEWLEMFYARKEIPGVSVNQKITASDEWCVEAYVDTDYSTISSEEFIQEMKKFMMFSIMEGRA